MLKNYYCIGRVVDASQTKLNHEAIRQCSLVRVDVDVDDERRAQQFMSIDN